MFWDMPGVGKHSSRIKRCMENQRTMNWNRATELLKQHADSQWYKEAALLLLWHSRRRGVGSLCLMHNRYSRLRNPDVLLKMLRWACFLPKNRIPHATVYPNLVTLLVANGDHLLEQHVKLNPSNASTPPNSVLLEAMGHMAGEKVADLV